jgi:hypothetical protein
MKILSREKSRVLAKQFGWSLARAEGFVDGERSRRLGLSPSTYVLVGIDEFSLGFREGFYERSHIGSEMRELRMPASR